MENPTLVVTIDAHSPEPERIAQVAGLVLAGGVVAVPTDTIYGLAADAANADAVERVFLAKGRMEDKPLPVFVSGEAQARELAGAWPELAARLAAEFWPGALTLIVAARPGLAAARAGGGTVALRQPAHAIVAALLAAARVPVTGTSANRSGQAACRDAAAVAAQLEGRIAAIVDGGASGAGLPSTILDVSGARPRLVREGAVTRAALAAWAPELA